MTLPYPTTPAAAALVAAAGTDPETPESVVSQQVLALDLRENGDSAAKAPPRLGLVTRGVPGRLATCEEVADVESIHSQPVDTAQPVDRRRIGNRHGARRRGNYSSFEELLAESTAVDDNGCWIWLRKLSKKGYGQIHALKGQPMRQAHRFVWENIRGPIPDGLCLDHLCGVRACVNPDHLEPVTIAENNKRSRAARGQYTGDCGHPAESHRHYPSGGAYCRDCGRERRAAARSQKQVGTG